MRFGNCNSVVRRACKIFNSNRRDRALAILLRRENLSWWISGFNGGV